jgi:activator of HSP90 ATPase
MSTSIETSAIEDIVEFPGITAGELFEIYMDSEKHAAATGGDVSLGRAPGSEFRAFGGGLRGRIFAVVPGKLIVQSWRAQTWKADDLDSVLTLAFSDSAAGARIHLVQANVPAHTHSVIKQGWKSRYWEPWRAFLQKSGLHEGPRP